MAGPYSEIFEPGLTADGYRGVERLADAARLGPVTDTDRSEIEAETVELLEGAAGVVDELGPHPEELVESARDALRRIFFEAQSTGRLWN